MTIKRRERDPVKSDWFKYCSICLEWLNPRANYTPSNWSDYVDQLLDTAQSVNVDTMAYIVDEGGLALWNSQFVERDSHLGGVDLFALLDAKTHERGMKLVASWLGVVNRNAGLLRETWRIRDAEGRAKGGEPEFVTFCCTNTPFANYTARQLEEVLAQYCIDGVYLEGLLLRLRCYCAYCREKFAATYGYPMPTDDDECWRSQDLRRFRADTMTAFVRRLRNVIDAVSPETAFMVCLYPGVDYEDVAAYADVTCMEQPDGRLIDMTQAMTRRPVVGTVWNSWHVDSDYMQRPAPQLKIWMAEKIAHGATPQVHVQDAFEVDRSLMPAIKEMYDLVHRVRPHMMDADRIAYAGLYLPWQKSKTYHFYMARTPTHTRKRIRATWGFSAPWMRHTFRTVACPDSTCARDR